MRFSTRNETPLGYALNFAVDSNFNFAVDNIFNNVPGNSSGIVVNEFLLLNGLPFGLLNGSNFLLL